MKTLPSKTKKKRTSGRGTVEQPERSITAPLADRGRRRRLGYLIESSTRFYQQLFRRALMTDMSRNQDAD